MSELTVLVSDDCHTLTLAGEIDIATDRQLDAALAGLVGDLVVDCAALEFIDSAGFYSLDRGYRAAIARGSTFVVSGMNDFQRRLATMLSAPYVIQATECRGLGFADGTANRHPRRACHRRSGALHRAQVSRTPTPRVPPAER